MSDKDKKRVKGLVKSMTMILDVLNETLKSQSGITIIIIFIIIIIIIIAVIIILSFLLRKLIVFNGTSQYDLSAL